ncbi:preprotein translocase subunit YajC [Tamilnaduibacter salinus]|nr:preprotein translocase subunit YajC [Tamilnaduibacter salinus]
MAQDASGQGMGVIGQIIFFAGFILIFYLLIWRPQSKRAKEHKALMAGLNKGDEVVTSGGVAGKITKVTDDFIVLEVADNVEMTVQKVAVASALPKGTLKDI